MKSIILIAATMLLGLASCASSEDPSLQWDGPAPSHLSSVMSVEALMNQSADDTAVIDLWTPDIGYWVEPGLDHRAIEVICPSGRMMNLEEWREEFQVSPALWQAGVIMFSSGNASFMVDKKLPPCNLPCELEQEADGTWACVGPGTCS